MNLSACNIAWNGSDDSRMFAELKKQDFSGIEIAPTRWYPSVPYSHQLEAKKYADELEKTYGLSVPSIQSVLYGRNENIFSNEEERVRLLEYLKEGIHFAEAVGAKNVVFGCPRNRNGYLSGDEKRNRRIATDFFHELGEYAGKHGTVLGLEANPHIYHTDFLNSTEETIRFIEEVGSDGLKLNLDIGTMVFYSEPLQMLKGKCHLINHVHVSEPCLKRIQKRSIHQELYVFLREEGYGGYISIEMSPTEEIGVFLESMIYVRRVFGGEV